MKSEKFKIDNIPAVMYGEKLDRCFLFIHGKFGCKEEAGDFAKTANKFGWQVLGIDLPGHGERKSEQNNDESFNPWCVIPELKKVVKYLKDTNRRLGLRANSIGAWFALQSFSGEEFEKSLFVSPVLDMETLIKNMMLQASVTEEELRKKENIPTDFGETLSWKYYCYVRENPILQWNGLSFILYADKDNLTSEKTVSDFSKKFNIKITAAKDAEHWFHTPSQLIQLNNWEEKILKL